MYLLDIKVIMKTLFTKNKISSLKKKKKGMKTKKKKLILVVAPWWTS